VNSYREGGQSQFIAKTGRRGKSGKNTGKTREMRVLPVRTFLGDVGTLSAAPVMQMRGANPPLLK
jgi:hypothetical protein